MKTRSQLLNDEIEKALETGQHSDELKRLFGPHEYHELCQLSRHVAAFKGKPGQRVLIIPGTMGSELGTVTKSRTDKLWIDPWDIIKGKLLQMTVPSSPAVVSIGAVLLGYLKLKFRLKAAGFDAQFYDYDWREDIPANGRTLGNFIRNNPFKDLALVGHSQGGLVARVALKVIPDSHKHVSKLIMLATPNNGTFAGLQVMRATFPLVQTLAVLDRKNDAVELAEKVFTTYPALCQMLPPPAQISGLDLFDLAGWPTVGPHPDATMLADSADLNQHMATADGRFFNIIGTNRETPVNVTRTDSQFVYTSTTDGDGTVSRTMCELTGSTTHYTGARHGSMGNNNDVANAVIEIIDTGSTSVLPDKVGRRSSFSRTLDETSLRATFSQSLVDSDLDDDDRRRVIDRFVSPVE